MARKPAPGTRERILRVASELFQRHGVRAVGMQQVVAESGLGKSLLYREFPSKDDLVAEWLRESDAAWWQKADAAMRRYDGDPARQLLALIELIDELVRSPDFHGCVFYNTATEFRDDAHPGRRQALEHLRRMQECLQSHAEAAHADDPAALADSLMLLIGGIYASGAAQGPQGPAAAGLSTAKSLIDLHCATGVTT